MIVLAFVISEPALARLSRGFGLPNGAQGAIILKQYLVP